MAIQQRFCGNHPTRPAIGVCVITRAAICGECSTRYEGVNYSREGLEILHRQRRAAAETKPKRGWVLPVLAWAAMPGLLYLLYLAYWLTSVSVINLLHRDY